MAAQRLPVPGQDNGTWGDTLNGFLTLEHNADGTLKIRTDGTVAPLTSGKVPVTNLGGGTASSSNFLRGDGTWAVPSGVAATGATTSSTGLIQLSGDLGGNGTSATTPVISDNAITTSKIAVGAVTTAKLGTGSVTSNEIADGTITNTDISITAAIARTKLDSSTQTSLGKADTALQMAPVMSVAGKTGAVILTSTDVGLTNVDNTSDVNKPISTATQTALNAKATSSSLATVATSGSYTDLTSKPTLSTVATSGSYTDLSNKPAIPTVSDATTTTKGIVQLTGDLAGTAASPTVPGLATKLTGSNNLSDLTTPATARTNLGLGTAATISSTAGGDLTGTLPSPTVAKINGIALPSGAPSAPGQVLTANSTTTTVWLTPSAGVTLDTTAADIVADTTTGTAVAGSTGKAADAGHQHPLVSHDHSTANKGGAIPESAVTNLTTDLAAKAPLASPTFTGTATAPNLTATTKTVTPALQVTTGAGTALQVLTSDTSGNAAWANQLVQGIQVNGGTVQTGTVALSLSQGLVPTAVKTSAYTAVAGDFIPVDATSGSVTITLPTAPADQTRIGIKVIATASTNTVTFTTGGSDVLNKAGGVTSGTLSLLNQAVILQYKLSSNIWYVTSTDVPLSQTDTRYLQATNNLSELTANAATVRANLGVDVSGAQRPTTTITAWAASTPYIMGQLVLSPSGAYVPGVQSLIQAIISFTSGASFVAGNWTRVSDFAPNNTSNTPDVQTFTTAGTWTKPSWATNVEVLAIGGGGAGASGGRQASGTISFAGSGGGGGAMSVLRILAGSLPATVSVTIGAGGTGGAAQTTNSTSGITGTNGGLSSFGTYVVANGGIKGGTSGGSTNGGLGGFGLFTGVQGGGTGATGGSGNSGNATTSGSGGAGSGGGGGGVTTTPTATSAGSGSNTLLFGASTSGGGGAAGTTLTPINGTAGADAGFASPGYGGGGGAGHASANAGNGANGGLYGGGGGGGGAALNGFNSGSGGNGANGIVVVTSW